MQAYAPYECKSRWRAEGTGCPRTGVTDNCEPLLSGCRQPPLAPQEQVLLTTESFITEPPVSSHRLLDLCQRASSPYLGQRGIRCSDNWNLPTTGLTETLAIIALSRQAPSGDEVAIKSGMEKLGFVLRVSLLQTPLSAAQVSVVPAGKNCG